MEYNVLDYDVSLLKVKYNISDIVAKTLIYNDLDEEAIKDVLSCNNEYHINNSEVLLKTVERIKQAKLNKEKVFIGGDYDSDGICATAIMKNTLDILGISNGYYIPDRFKEGYGLSARIVELAYQKGYTLIITVDNGVKAFEAINKARELGIDLIISDHHIIEDKLDELVVHPDYMDPIFKGLCGAGVALQLALRLIGENELNDCLAMIATIGDCMQLFNENRVIVKKGLKLVHKFPQITTLIGKNNDIEVEDISFYLVPKLNSIARLDDDSNANVLVQYLLSKDINVIKKISTQINSINIRRKNLSNQMSNTAKELIKDDAFIILYDESFSEGLVGLVAGKIAREQNKPCICFAKNEGKLKGSGRSIKGFDMYTFFKDFNLGTFGGHAQAVGLAIDESELDAFKEKVLTKMKDIKITDTLEDVLRIKSKDITINNIEQLRLLEPFGQGFKKPKFYVDDYNILKSTILKEKYIKFNFEENFEAISFNVKHKECRCPRYIVGDIGLNYFMNRVTCSLNIKDME